MNIHYFKTINEIFLNFPKAIVLIAITFSSFTFLSSVTYSDDLAALQPQSPLQPLQNQANKSANQRPETLNQQNPETLDQQQVDELIIELDKLSHFDSDLRAQLYLQQKHREKGDLLYKAVVYRQDENDRLMMMFIKPKSDAGKGYLVIEENLFLYTPSTGAWTRVSEDRISGTDSNMGDFDETSLATQYNAHFIDTVKLGKFSVYHLSLESKPGQQVKTPKLELWIDTRKHHMLKMQEFALSGRLLRTTYRTRWRPIEDDKARQRYFPMETRIYDEVEKGNQTTMVFDKITLNTLPSKIFTKAWLESKSR